MKCKCSLGYTLGELLIAVAIIAVLVAITIPLYVSHVEKTRETVDLDNLSKSKRILTYEYTSPSDFSIKEGVVYYYYANASTITDKIEDAYRGKSKKYRDAVLTVQILGGEVQTAFMNLETCANAEQQNPDAKPQRPDEEDEES